MQTLYIIVSIAATLVTTFVPSIIALVKALKAKNSAQTTASSEQATNAINAEVKRLVQNAEISLEAIDKILKANNSGTAGKMKKRDVVMELKTFCLENGYAWNDAEMNELIEKEVAYTKAVNAK